MNLFVFVMKPNFRYKRKISSYRCPPLLLAPLLLACSQDGSSAFDPGRAEESTKLGLSAIYTYNTIGQSDNAGGFSWERLAYSAIQAEKSSDTAISTYRVIGDTDNAGGIHWPQFVDSIVVSNRSVSEAVEIYRTYGSTDDSGGLNEESLVYTTVMSTRSADKAIDLYRTVVNAPDAESRTSFSLATATIYSERSAEDAMSIFKQITSMTDIIGLSPEDLALAAILLPGRSVEDSVQEARSVYTVLRDTSNELGEDWRFLVIPTLMSSHSLVEAVTVAKAIRDGASSAGVADWKDLALITVISGHTAEQALEIYRTVADPKNGAGKNWQRIMNCAVAQGARTSALFGARSGKTICLPFPAF